MSIILYSNHCPQCRALSTMLKQKGLEYSEENDINLMLSKGLNSAPNLEVDGNIMTFKEAIEWLKTI